MIKLVLKKLVQGILTITCVSIIAFAMLSAAGGDALTALGENPQVSRETIDRLRAIYGLDKPIAHRYLSWAGMTLRGDLGESFIYRTPVLELVLSRAVNTLEIALPALFLAFGFAILTAYFIERTRSQVLSKLVDRWIAVSASLPRIVAALWALLIIVMIKTRSSLADGSYLLVMVACATVIALPLQAVLLAQAKAELHRAALSEFVQFARSKGLSERVLLLRHALREALNPLITLVGLSVGSIVSGSIIVETVLGWPGIGALMVGAVRARDVSLVMGIVLVTSFIVWIANSFAEVLQALNDPRSKVADGKAYR